MRRLLFAIAVVGLGFAGCESKPTDAGQDKSKAVGRPLMKPGASPEVKVVATTLP